MVVALVDGGQRALQTLAISIFMAFMVGDLDLELDIVTNVGVLPHQELYT